jgi:PGF-pre-PGF domain-containing protein
MKLKRLTYFGVILLILLIAVATGAPGNSTTDTTELDAAITSATAKADSAVAGTGVGQYPQSAITALNAAIKEAQSVADDTNSIQDDIDQALTTLNEAIKDFDSAKITGADKTALTAAIKTANTKVKAAVAGTDIGQYPQSAIDTFKTAISAAQKVLDNKSAKQTEVNQAVTTLKAAQTKFDAAKITGADKTALTAAITTANTKVKAAVAGTDIGQYPQSAIDTFKTAITAAQKVADNADATQTEVNQAVTTLKAAQKKFDAAKITTVDKTALTAAMTTANTKVKAAVAGTDIGQYPQSAIDAFKTAISAAQKVADDTTATADEVTQAVTDLKAAQKKFDAAKISTVNKDALTTAIEEASTKAEAAVAGTDYGQYPQSAIDTFNAAIAAAQEIADDATATTDEVAQAVTDLETAEDVFDAAKITTVDKAALTAVIEEASTKAKKAVAGTEAGQYPQSAIDALNTAIATAQEVAEDATATESEVAQAITNLKAAKTTFDAAEITVNIILPYVTKLEETATGSDWINWNWVNPTEEDFSHVMIYMNGTFVADTSADPSVHSYNATGLAAGTTYTISISTVDVAGNISSTGVNDSATTTGMPVIYNVHGADITNTSITLKWEASSDTTSVQISRDGTILGNVSGVTSYVDGNLSIDTTYSYTLVPYDESGLAGKAVTLSLVTNASDSKGSSGGSSSGSSSGSSGGGGGGGSSEDFANIALKDADTEYLTANANVTYEFTKNGIDIMSVSFYSLKTSGEITSTVELLKNQSKLVNSTPEGDIYEYINIWVGKAGFATTTNIDKPHIIFKVKTSWIKEMGIKPTDVRLQRYNGTAWEVLPTTVISETTDYVVFDSQTPGFSPFAITAEKSLASPITTETVKEAAKAAIVTTQQVVQEKKNTIWTFVIAIAAVEVLSIGFEYYRRKR